MTHFVRIAMILILLLSLTGPVRDGRMWIFYELPEGAACLWGDQHRGILKWSRILGGMVPTR